MTHRQICMCRCTRGVSEDVNGYDPLSIANKNRFKTIKTIRAGNYFFLCLNKRQVTRCITCAKKDHKKEKTNISWGPKFWSYHSTGFSSKSLFFPMIIFVGIVRMISWIKWHEWFQTTKGNFSCDLNIFKLPLHWGKFHHQCLSWKANIFPCVVTDVENCTFLVYNPDPFSLVQYHEVVL